jgi:hypothetical protein
MAAKRVAWGVVLPPLAMERLKLLIRYCMTYRSIEAAKRKYVNGRAGL